MKKLTIGWDEENPSGQIIESDEEVNDLDILDFAFHAINFMANDKKYGDDIRHVIINTGRKRRDELMKKLTKTILTASTGIIIGAGLAWTGANQLDNVEHQVIRMEGMIRTLTAEISEWDNLTQDQRDRIEYLENMIGGENYYGDNSGLLGEILRLESELRQANEDAQHLYDSANIWYGYAREGFESRARIGGEQ